MVACRLKALSGVDKTRNVPYKCSQSSNAFYEMVIMADATGRAPLEHVLLVTSLLATFSASPDVVQQVVFTPSPHTPAVCVTLGQESLRGPQGLPSQLSVHRKMCMRGMPGRAFRGFTTPLLMVFCHTLI